MKCLLRRYSMTLARLAVPLLLLTLAWNPDRAAAQDSYHQWVIDLLADYHIEGGQMLLGTNENAVLSGGRWISDSEGTSTAETITVDESEGLPFTQFNRYVHRTVTANWYDALTRFVDVAPVETGDVALLVLLMRGESLSGGVGSVELVFDMNEAPFTRALSVEELLQPEWTQVLIPFEMPFSRGAGGANFGLNFGLKEVQVDIATPVVLNFGDKYTLEALQALIDAQGELPLLAAFTADAVRGVPPFEVNFDASGSTAPGTITNYAWKFGDGSSGTGQTASHTYTEFGTYTVELTITDNNGATDTATRTVVVFDGRGLAESPLDIPFAATAPTVDGEIDAVERLCYTGRRGMGAFRLVRRGPRARSTRPGVAPGATWEEFTSRWTSSRATPRACSISARSSKKLARARKLS